MSQVVGLPNNSYKPITNTAWVRARLCKLQKKGAFDSQPQVIKFTSCLPMVGGSLRVLQLLPTLKLHVDSVTCKCLQGKWSDVSGRRYCLLWCMVLTSSGYFTLAVASTLSIVMLARLQNGETILKFSGLSYSYSYNGCKHMNKKDSCSSVNTKFFMFCSVKLVKLLDIYINRI